jgi:hypothetical protein
MFKVGEPLWLSGKVVENEKKMKSRGPGFAPHPRQPLLKKDVQSGLGMFSNTFSLTDLSNRFL